MADTNQDLPATPALLLESLDIAEINTLLSQSVTEFACTLGCSRAALVAYTLREKLLRGVASYPSVWNPKIWRWYSSDYPEIATVIRTEQANRLTADTVLPPEWGVISGDKAILFPVCFLKRLLGVMVVVCEDTAQLDSDEWREIAEAKIDNLALLMELERVASAYQDELRLRFSARELTNTILDGSPVAEIADCITGIVASRLQEPRVGLFLKDDFEAWQPLSLRELSPAFGATAAKLAACNDTLLKLSQTGFPLLLENVTEQPEFTPALKELFAQEEVESVLLGWMTSQERLLGAIAVYPRSSREFSPSELSALQDTAELATLGFSLATLLAKQRTMAIVEERSRLAREMHDTVAQSLAGLLMQLENSQTLLASGDLSTGRNMLGQAQSQARRALEDTRLAVQNLSALEAETRTAAQLIEEEVAAFEQITEISAAFLLSGEQRELTPEIRLTLLRITQEALTNARKHAQAKRLRVGLQFSADHRITLLIEDDGVGFDRDARSAPSPEGGYGLFGMEERARLVGGTLEIDSNLGWGTRIRTVLPCPERENRRTGNREQNNAASNDPMTQSPNDPMTQRPNDPIVGQETDTRIRVLIVDDYFLTRQGITSLLSVQPQICVIGEAVNGQEAIAFVQNEMPDVILMDLQMPVMGGIEAMRRIHEFAPELPIVILTTMSTDEAVRESLQAGAAGFLLKDTDAAEITAGIIAAIRGEALLAPAILGRLANLTRTPEKTADMTERDLEILRYLVQGFRNKELAEKMFVTTSTIEYHLSNLFSKLGVSNRAEAVRTALERHLISVEN